MILNRPLNEEELACSQKNYFRFYAVNGFSYTCLGETVLTLFAVNLGCSDTVIAILVAMLYVGYVMLPLGKWMTARVGAVRCQADCWIMRNLSALLVALSAPIYLYFSKGLAVALILLGAFLFYGFRAAGVVMSQPLIGEICPKESQGRFISISQVFFHSFALLALLLITLARKINENIWVLFGVIVMGTICGFISSGFFRKIHEAGQVRDYAKKPITNSIGEVCRNPTVRAQLIAGMICNLGNILVCYISLLALKRGYQISDSKALLYTLVLSSASITGNWLLSKVADRFGGRRLILAGFYGLYLICIFWICTPATFFWPLLIIPFLLGPSGNVVIANSLQQYFLATVPKKQQVVASLIISVGTGVASGLIGMFICSLLLKLAAHFNAGGAPLMTYKYYYASVLILLPFLSIFVHKLKRE